MNKKELKYECVRMAQDRAREREIHEHAVAAFAAVRAMCFVGLLAVIVLLGLKSCIGDNEEVSARQSGVSQLFHTPDVQVLELSYYIEPLENKIFYDVTEYTPDMYADELFADSVEYLACCVEAEAGNQSELGKRLVCDVVLNRFYKGDYTTLYDVINEEGQFAVVDNGSINTAIPTEETYAIVREELEHRTNTEVLYFRTEHYHPFGEPMFQEQAHFFSK